MHDGSGRIVVQNLTKHFGQVAAVQNLSFHVEPGSVTGFLGPNGSGKTTTLRMILGLVRPTAGWSTINGQPFNQLGNPARVVGGVLEAQGFHPGRTALDHLRVYSAAMGVPDQRASEVLHMVGLAAAGNRAAGGFSLGMKQRLALATALLGDPQVLVLDEPANGLDPEGIAWLRTFLKAFAQSGRTVLISSHLLAEVEQTIDHAVIISRGQTMYSGPLEELRKSQQSRVVVQPADPQKLAIALQEAKITNVSPTPDGKLAVVGATIQQIGDIAAREGIALYGVHEERADLEQLFFRLTSGQYAGQSFAQGPPPGWQGPPGQAGYAPGTPPGGYQQAAPGTPPGGYQQPAPPADYQQAAPGGYQQAAPGTPPGGYQQAAPGTPPEGYQQAAPGTPPGGYQQAAPEGYQQAAPGTPPGGYQQPPPGGYQQAAPEGYQQAAPGTPPGGYHQPAPEGYQQAAPGTPPGGYQQAPGSPTGGYPAAPAAPEGQQATPGDPQQAPGSSTGGYPAAPAAPEGQQATPGGYQYAPQPPPQPGTWGQQPPQQPSDGQNNQGGGNN